MVKYSISNKNMKKGYWKIVNDKGITIKSGIANKKAVIKICEIMNNQESS